MDSMLDWMVRLASNALPQRDRDAVLGDLLEEASSREAQRPRMWRLRATLGVVLHYHAEPYRDPDQRLAWFVVSVVALGLLWLVPLAASNMFVDPELLAEPVVRIAAAVWGASHVTSGIAAGLFVGRTSFLSRSDALVRWHIGCLLVAYSALFSPTVGSAMVTVCVIGAALALGDQARRAAVEDIDPRLRKPT